MTPFCFSQRVLSKFLFNFFFSFSIHGGGYSRPPFFRRIAIAASSVWTRSPGRSPMAPCPASPITRFPPPAALSLHSPTWCTSTTKSLAQFPSSPSARPPLPVASRHRRSPLPTLLLLPRRPYEATASRHPRRPSPPLASRTLPVILSLSAIATAAGPRENSSRAGWLAVADRRRRVRLVRLVRSSGPPPPPRDGTGGRRPRAFCAAWLEWLSRWRRSRAAWRHDGNHFNTRPRS